MTLATTLLVLLANYTFLILGLLSLSTYLPVCAFIARSILAFTCLGLCALYGAFASILLRCVGYAGLGQYTTARAFKWTMWVTTGVTFVVEGVEHLSGERGEIGGGRPAVLVGNHQTELDVLMLGCVFPPYCSVSAKRSLKWTPLLGQFMAFSKTVFIDRGNRSSARAAFASAASMMNTEKQSVWIFPEGTRSYASEPTMLPFKKGAFHLAVQAQVPVVPVVVANYSDIFRVGGTGRGRWFGSGRVPVRVLPPIPTKGLTTADVDDLVQRTRDTMLKELVSLTATARTQGNVDAKAR